MRYACLLLAALVWSSAAPAQTNPAKPTLVIEAGGHTAPIRKVLFRGPSQMVTISDDKTVRVWPLIQGGSERVFRLPAGPGRHGQLYAAAVARGGNLVAVAGHGDPADQAGTIYLINTSDGKIERVLRGHPGVVLALAWSRDGKWVASGGHDRKVRLWEVATGALKRTLDGHTDAVHDLVISPNSQWLVSVSADKTARVWSVPDGRSEAVLEGHTDGLRCVAWSPDGRTLATGGLDQSVRLWEGDQGFKFRRSFDKLGSWVSAVDFTVDSRELFVARGNARDKSCSLFEVEGGRERLKFGSTYPVRHGAMPLYSADRAAVVTTLYGRDVVSIYRGPTFYHIGGARSRGSGAKRVAWSKDGTSIAWGPWYQRSLEHSWRLSAVETGPAPDGSYRAAQVALGPVALERAGDSAVAVKRDGKAVVELRPGERVHCYTLLSGDRAAVGTESGLHLFDTATGKLIRTFRGDGHAVWAVAPSPDNCYLLSGGDEHALRIWHPDQDEPVLSLFYVDKDDWVVWTAEGYYATGEKGGEKYLGRYVNNGPDQLGSVQPIEPTRKTHYRPEVIPLVLEAGGGEKAVALLARGRPGARGTAGNVQPPKVVLTAPTTSGLRLTKPQVEVQATAQSVGDHPVTVLRLFLNGRPYQGSGGVKTLAAPKLGEVRETWTVALTPGKHRLTIQAESAVSQAFSNEVEVVYLGGEPPEVGLPRLYVLAVGISTYPGNLKLNYAAKDAKAIELVFKEKSGPLFRKIETKLLTDAQASRTEVLKGLTWLRKEATQGDVAIFFFAGHGQKDADGRFYLLPADGDPDNLLATAVAHDDVKSALRGIPGKALALLDACHAGAAGGDKRRSAGILSEALVRDLVTEDRGVVLMASAMGQEFALESNEHRHGCFTLALVEGLSGKAERSMDGAIYLHKLESYVTDRVKELTKGQQHPVTAKPTSIRSFPLARP